MKALKFIARGAWIAGIAALGLAAPSATASMLVYEPFDYPGENQNLNGQGGGVGFASDWLVTGWNQGFQTGRTTSARGEGTTQNADGGLDFPGLDTAGSALTRFGNAGQRNASRILSSSVQTQLTADNTTMWFGILLGAPSDGSKNASFIFGTDDFNAAAWQTGGQLNSGGQAFGVSLRIVNEVNESGWENGRGSPNAIAFINSILAVVDESSFIPELQENGTHHDTMLVVGKINWNPLGTPDELFLFNVTSPGGAEPDEADAIAYLSADFDQANFNMIALHDSGTTILDEIRLGTTYEAVTIPEPSAFMLLGLAGLPLILRRLRRK